MPVASSYADVITDWEALLMAVLENAPNLPDVERTRAAFQEHVAKTKEVKARQDSHTAARQEATQELKQRLKDGREFAIRLRGVVKANIGPKSERLVQFGIAPIRKRTRKPAATPPVVEPPAPGTPTPPGDQAGGVG